MNPRDHQSTTLDYPSRTPIESNGASSWAQLAPISLLLSLVFCKFWFMLLPNKYGFLPTLMFTLLALGAGILGLRDSARKHLSIVFWLMSITGIFLGAAATLFILAMGYFVVFVY